MENVRFFYHTYSKDADLTLPLLQIPVKAPESKRNFAHVIYMIRLCHLYDSTLPNHINGKAKK